MSLDKEGARHVGTIHQNIGCGGCWFCYQLTSLVAQTVKHLPTMRETRVQSLGWEDLLEKEMATHYSILTWKIPCMGESGRLQSMGSQRVGHDWETSFSLCTFKNLIFSTHFHLGMWLLAWLLSPPLTLPFLSQVTSISSLPLLFSSLLYLTLWISLGVLSCGEHFSSLQSLSCVRLFVTPWNAARQAFLSITISWSSLKLTNTCFWLSSL